MYGHAQIIDDMTYVASPFVNHTFFLASSAWLQDYRIRTGRNVLASSSASGEASSAPFNSSTNILAQVALSNFTTCQEALTQQTKYWLGVGWIGAIIAKSGNKASRSSIKTATEGIQTFVSGPEMVRVNFGRALGILLNFCRPAGCLPPTCSAHLGWRAYARA